METDPAGERYSRTLVRFVSAFLRSMHREMTRFRLPLPEAAVVKAEELYRALETLPATSSKSSRKGPVAEIPGPEADAALKLQEFFFSSVVDSVPESRENKFKCPVLAYTACFAYNEDDTWKLAPQVTSMLAQWSFLLRGTSIYHAKVEHSRTGVPAAE